VLLRGGEGGASVGGKSVKKISIEVGIKKTALKRGWWVERELKEYC